MPNSKKIVRAGLIAGLYVVLSLLTFPIASGVIQFRLSEALTLLPLFFPEAIPAVFVGCLLSNLLTGCVILDVILGSTITLCAGVCTYFVGRCFSTMLKKIAIGGIFPILLNAFLLPLIWLVAYKTGEFVYILQVFILLISQSVSVYLFGTLLCVAVNKLIEKK